MQFVHLEHMLRHGDMPPGATASGGVSGVRARARVGWTGGIAPGPTTPGGDTWKNGLNWNSATTIRVQRTVYTPLPSIYIVSARA